MTLPQVGDRVRLIEMPNDPAPLPPGSEGTVTNVTEFAEPLPTSISTWDGLRPVETQLPAADTTAQIGVDWDTGSRLQLLVPGDRFEVIP